VLIVDDDAERSGRLVEELTGRGILVERVTSVADIEAALSVRRFDAAVVEETSAGASVIEVLELLGRRSPRARVAVVTASPSVGMAVDVMRRGAREYLVRPVTVETIVSTLGLAAPGSIEADHEIVTGCAEMTAVIGLIERVAAAEIPVLISGESGTGKELIARAIHRRSARAQRPFVAINCGALSGELLDSELFGHVRGAFTGAVEARRGLFEAADGGVIFLDEIASAAASSQVRLLRVLEDGEVRPVGSSATVVTDVRVIAATRVDLQTEVRLGRFRDDLFFRLNVIDLRLPPLRERAGDVDRLVRHFIGRTAPGRQTARLDEEMLRALRAHAWPGNVRELRNTIERALLLAGDDELTLEHLPVELVEAADLELPGLLPYGEAKRAALSRFQRDYLGRLLDLCGGNISAAARAARVPRQTLYRLLREVSSGADPSPHRQTSTKPQEDD